MWLIRGQLQRASAASAEVCGDDVNSEHGGGGDRDQPVAALDPRDTSVYCLQCLHIARVALALS